MGGTKSAAGGTRNDYPLYRRYTDGTQMGIGCSVAMCVSDVAHLAKQQRPPVHEHTATGPQTNVHLISSSMLLYHSKVATITIYVHIQLCIHLCVYICISVYYEGAADESNWLHR